MKTIPGFLNLEMKKVFLFLLLFTSYFYSYSQNTWISKANLGGLARHGAIGFSIGTKGYLGTGFAANFIAQNDLWEWDQPTNVWTQKANVPGTARGYAAGFSIGTKGYIGTGYDSTGIGVTNDFYEYDPTLNTWTQKANFAGPPRDAPVSFSIGNKGYIGTGDDSGSPVTYFNDFWEYDPSIDTWEQKTNLPSSPRSNAVGFSIGTKGYIGTGSNGANFGHDFYEWDQATDTWTQKANYTGGARWCAAGFSIGSKGYIGTGADSIQNIHSDFREYDPTTNSWTQRAVVLGGPKWSAVGFSIGNKGYIGTGANPNFSSLTVSFYEYTPFPAGIEEHDEMTTNIYPNPFTSSTTFELNKELKNAQLKLFDVLGKEVRSIYFSANKISLEREKLESGIYFYQISLENKIVSSGKLMAE